MRNKIIILIIGLCLPGLAFAGVKSGGRIMTWPVSAKALGMAEACVGQADDLYAIHYNPAGLNQLPNPQVGVTYLTGIDDTYFGYLGYAMPIGLDAGMGVSIAYLNGGEMTVWDVNGTETNVTASQDILAVLSGGMRIYGKNMLGINIKLFNSTLVETYKTTVVAFDGGLLYELNRQIKFGFVVRNIGPNINYQTSGDPLPTTVIAGIAYRQSVGSGHDLKVNIDIEKPLDQNYQPRIGAEYTYQQMYMLRLGYHAAYYQHELTAGCGLTWEWISLDYAFRILSEVGNNHHITLSYSF